MNHSEELRELREIAEIPVERLSIHGKIKKTNCAKWAVEEIRRLRAKVNRLIKAISDAESNGNHNYNDNDLILEEET